MFNPPHASHMGGAWERMIGVTRRILDSMMKEHSAQGLTHEVLTTFLAEASAIIISRPLTSIPPDPDSPFILTPSILLESTVEESTRPRQNDLGQMEKGIPPYLASSKEVAPRSTECQCW